MKVLVILDVHLKPHMFQQAARLMERGVAEQVVGHTPVDEISRKENVISCDVFSTYRDGRPIGTQEFLLIDTETWEYSGVKG